MNGGDGILSVFLQGSADYPCSLLRCCSAVEGVAFRPGTNDLCRRTWWLSRRLPNVEAQSRSRPDYALGTLKPAGSGKHVTPRLNELFGRRMTRNRLE